MTDRAFSLLIVSAGAAVLCALLLAASAAMVPTDSSFTWPPVLLALMAAFAASYAATGLLFLRDEMRDEARRKRMAEDGLTHYRWGGGMEG
jgi:hypothetical protein